jgi:hypothetical protein
MLSYVHTSVVIVCFAAALHRGHRVNHAYYMSVGSLLQWSWVRDDAIALQAQLTIASIHYMNITHTITGAAGFGFAGSSSSSLSTLELAFDFMVSAEGAFLREVLVKQMLSDVDAVLNRGLDRIEAAILPRQLGLPLPRTRRAAQAAAWANNSPSARESRRRLRRLCLQPQIMLEPALGVRLALVVAKLLVHVGLVAAWHVLRRIASDALVPARALASMFRGGSSRKNNGLKRKGTQTEPVTKLRRHWKPKWKSPAALMRHKLQKRRAAAKSNALATATVSSSSSSSGSNSGSSGGSGGSGTAAVAVTANPAKVQPSKIGKANSPTASSNSSSKRQLKSALA